jgi:hypothetical protein
MLGRAFKPDKEDYCLVSERKSFEREGQGWKVRQHCVDSAGTKMVLMSREKPNGTARKG